MCYSRNEEYKLEILARKERRERDILTTGQSCELVMLRLLILSLIRLLLNVQVVVVDEELSSVTDWVHWIRMKIVAMSTISDARRTRMVLYVE